MRNISANALMNLKEVPQTLYVHGSIMTYHADDKISIEKANPQGINPSILILDLAITQRIGPMKGTPKAFKYESSEEIAKSYTQVTIRYSDEETLTVNVEELA